MKKPALLCVVIALSVAFTGSKPLKDEMQYLEFEEVFRIGDNLENEEEMFSHIGKPFIDVDMNLYVRDFGSNQIQVFDKEGEYVFELGRVGQAPGEYQRVGDIFSDTNGDIVLHDGRSLKFIYMNRNGEHIRDEYYGDDLKKRISYPNYLSTGELLFCSKNRKDDRAKIACTFQKLNHETEEVSTLFTCVEEWNVLYGEGGGHSSAIKYYMQSYVSPADEVYLVNSGEYVIDVFSRDGKKAHTLSNKKYKRVERPAEERKRPLAGNDKEQLYPSKYYDDIRSVYFPIPGQCWVLPSRTIDGMNTIDVFDDSGKYVHQLILKTPPSNRLNFFRDPMTQELYLYQVELSEDDEEMIVCYHTSFK